MESWGDKTKMTPYELIKSDLYRYCGQYNRWLLLKNLINSNRAFRYSFWLRLLNAANPVVRLIARLSHRHLSVKYQIQIPKEVKIGPGLYLGHATSIIINASAVIGKNCNLSQFVTIGSNHGKAAVIGDNCYIGPNVCLVEHVVIGNHAVVGAGSVVVKNVPEATTAVGNPARILEGKPPQNYIQNPFGGAI